MEEAAAITETEPLPLVDETVRLLAPLPIFAELDAKSLRAVARRCRIVTLRAGETVMEEGQLSDFAAMILAGEVDVLVSTPAGRVNVATSDRRTSLGSWVH
jgi:CRP-like cAMP-binding protein